MKENQLKVNPAIGALAAVCIFLLGGAAGNLVWKGEITQAQRSMAIDLAEIRSKLDYITELRGKTADLERRVGALERRAGIADATAGDPYLVDGRTVKSK